MLKKDFSRKVLNIVAQIPKGKVMTYSQVAKKAGSPQAYRAVGSILNRNYRGEKLAAANERIRTGSLPSCHSFR